MSLRLYNNEIKQRNRQFERAEKLHGDITGLEKAIEAAQRKIANRRTRGADELTEMAIELNAKIEEWKRKVRALHGITSTWPQIADGLEYHRLQLASLSSVAEISSNASHAESVQSIHEDLNALAERIESYQSLVRNETPDEMNDEFEAKNEMMRKIQMEIEKKERTEPQAQRTETTASPTAQVSQAGYQHPPELLEAIGHHNTISTAVLAAHQVVFRAATNKNRKGKLTAANVETLREALDAAIAAHDALARLATSSGGPFAFGFHQLASASLPQLRQLVKAANGMLPPRARRLALGRVSTAN